MKIVSYSVNDTLRIGRVISRHLKEGDILCLFGELGSGKTVLTKGIALGLGIAKNSIISPTFVLIRQYHKAKLPLFHFDLYRLKGDAEIMGLGYHEYFYDEAVTVIEWANKLNYLMPKECLKVKLQIESFKKRIFKFTSLGRRHRELLSRIHEDIRN